MREYTREMIKKFIPEWILKIRRKYVVYKKPIKSTERRKILRFEVHLADHCNLNCISCSHFCSLAKEAYLDVDMFQRDCERIAELSKGQVEQILFLGGEPLLHNRVVDIFKIGRLYFPNAKLAIITNGLLLPKQADLFWIECNKNDVHIHVSKYPIKINHSEIDRLTNKYNVKIAYLGTKGTLVWRDMKLDTTQGQNINESFNLCYQSNLCINLYEGKLYTCPTIPYIKYINEFFGEHFEVSENDYIDIYKTESMNEILDFLCKPVPFCKYCNIKDQQVISWAVSKRDIKEWIKK